MANNNHGHHENHEHHHGYGHGHGHGNGDTDEGTLPTPLTFTLLPNTQAIITVAFYGTLQKQIILKEQSGADIRTYTSCIDGRRPYIVITNTSSSQTLYYSITPSVYANICTQPMGSSIDIALKGTITGSSSVIQASTLYGYYVPTTTYYPEEQVGITIVIQDKVGDLYP